MRDWWSPVSTSTTTSITVVSMATSLEAVTPPSLRALLCFNNNEERLQKKQLEYIHKGLGLLRVLSLEGVMFPPTLPDAIGNLAHLSYLELGRDGLVRLPSTIGNLKNLKTLDARCCNDLVLPIVMWKMKELRHIILTPTAVFENQSKSIDQLQPIEDVSLPNLQTLHIINGNILKADCLRKFTNLRNLGLVCDVTQVAIILSDAKPISDKLEKLTLTVLPSKQGKETKVDFFYTDTYPLLDLPACPALSFSAYQNLSNLYLEGGFKKLLKFPTSLIKLTLSQTQLEEDPMETLGKLPELKKLYLRRFSYMGPKMVISGPDSFPLLEDLIIEPMPLKELKVDEGVMPNLRYVKINLEVTLDIHSDRLKRIFSEFNDYLMRMSFLELEMTPVCLDDIFIWEEEDLILEASKDANKGKELMPDEVTKQDTVEDQNGISGRPLELGQCSSSGGQGESKQRKSGDAISRSFQNLSASVSSRRPWPEFVAADVFHCPDSLTIAGERVCKNANYFRINYAILILGCAMVSLVGTPISLMVWVLTLGIWLIFYFFREDPLIVGGRQVSDQLVLLCLVMASVMAVWFTGVLENLVVGVGIGLLACCVHGVFRNPLEDGEAGLRESALTH